MDHPKIQQDTDGNLRLNVGEYGGEVEVAAVSGDLAVVLTVLEVGVAKVWMVDNGDMVAELRPDSPLTDDPDVFGGEFGVFIESAALNRDGSLALLGLNDGTAVIYRVSDGVQLAVLAPPGEQLATKFGVIRAVAYSSNGAYALVGFPGRRVGVWTADGQRLVAFLSAPVGAALVSRPTVRNTLITSLASSGDGRFVFAGAADTTATVFEIESSRVCFEAVDSADEILAVYDGAEGIGWATTGGIMWIEDDQGRPRKVLETGENWAEVVFDDGRLLTRGRTGVSIWSFDGSCTHLSKASAPWASRAQTLSIAGETVLFPSSGMSVVLRQERRSTVVEREHQLVRARLTPDGEHILTDGWLDAVELWDARSGNLLRTFPCAGGSGCFAVSPDGALLATGEIGHGGGRYPRQVYVYQLSTGELLTTLHAHDWQVRELAFSPDGSALASLGDELVVWGVDGSGVPAGSPFLRHRVQRATGSFAWSNDELVVAEKGGVSVFRGDALDRSFPAPIFYETAWRISADGRHILIAGNQRVVSINLRTGAVDRVVEADVVRPERFPPIDLVEHEIRVVAMLWRTDYGPFLHQSDGPRGWVQPLQLSTDRLVAVPCADGAVVMHVGTEDIELVGKVPFTGKLRAGRANGGQVVLVNHEGRVFRAEVPSHS